MTSQSIETSTTNTTNTILSEESLPQTDPNSEATPQPATSPANNTQEVSPDSQPAPSASPLPQVPHQNISIDLPTTPARNEFDKYEQKAGKIGEKNTIIQSNKENFAFLNTRIIASKIDLKNITYTENNNPTPAKIFITRTDLHYSKISGLATLNEVNLIGADVSELRFLPLTNPQNEMAVNDFLNKLYEFNTNKYQDSSALQDNVETNGISWEMIYDAVTSGDDELKSLSIQLLKNIDIKFNKHTKFLNDKTKNEALYQALIGVSKKIKYNPPLDENEIKEAFSKVVTLTARSQDVVDDILKPLPDPRPWTPDRFVKAQEKAIEIYAKKLKKQRYTTDSESFKELAKDFEKNYKKYIRGVKEDSNTNSSKKYFIISSSSKDIANDFFIFEINEKPYTGGNPYLKIFNKTMRHLEEHKKLRPEHILAHFIWGCELTEDNGIQPQQLTANQLCNY